MFTAILNQSIKLSFRKGGGALGACAFYVIVVTLFTFALGVAEAARFALPIMCVSLLLATITTLPLMFERDHEDGTLEQLILQPVLLEFLVLSKIIGQWCSQIAPILLVSPLLALMSDMDFETAKETFFTLLLASPTIVAIGAISASLTLGSKRGGLLQALVVMPFYVPVLIFSSGNGGAMFLAGMMCASLPLACYACAALVRVSVD